MKTPTVLSQSVGCNVLRQVYFAYFQSLLSYGVMFWGNSSESNRVFLLQKKVVRLISGAGPRDSCKHHFQQLQILPLPCILILHCSLFVKKNYQRFSSKNHVHSHFTRNSSILQYPIHRTTFFERSPFYLCISIFNHLPDIIKEEQSTQRFKMLVGKFLIQHCFYSVAEYLNTSRQFTQ